jgi:type VI secretion system FHA domain protein
MSLVLRGVSLNEQPISRPLIGRFDERGGTLGRSDDSTLTLPDPERLISRQQAQVVHNGRQFWIENLSAASVILHNGRPLSTGMRVVLHNGDELKIGGYTLQASLQDDAENATILLGRAGVPAVQAARPLAPKLRAVPTEILPSTLTEPLDKTFLLELREAQERAPETREREPEPQRSAEPERSVIETQPRAPEPVAPAVGPEPVAQPLAPAPSPSIVLPLPPQAPPALAKASDSKPKAPARRPMSAVRKAKPSESRKPNVKHKAPEMQPSTTDSKHADDAASLWRSFLQGAGVEPSGQEAPSAAVMGSIGEMLRIAVGGIQHLMMLRAKAKNVMRTEATMLQVRDNNPLKFSRDPDAALAMLLQPPARGFLDAPAALRASLNDLECHQAGMAAGMRAVLAAALDRLDPAKLGPPRRRSLLNILRPSRKAQLWDKYRKQHEALGAEVRDDFERLFGELLRTSYEARAPLRK